MGPIGCNCPDYCDADNHREENTMTVEHFVFRYVDPTGGIYFKEVYAGSPTAALDIFVRNYPNLRPTSIFKHAAKVGEVKAYKIA